jgi:ribosomal protein L15
MNRAKGGGRTGALTKTGKHGGRGRAGGREENQAGRLLAVLAEPRRQPLALRRLSSLSRLSQ